MEKQLELCPGAVLLQDDRFFPLGEDTMVLSAFAAPKKGARVLDLCAGQGFLGILVGLRRPDVSLEGLELLEEACAVARQNALRAGLDLPVHRADLRQTLPGLNGRFDWVVCNPPYYEQDRGKVAEGPLGAARSDAGASIGQVCAAAGRALKTGGHLCLCFPAARLQDVTDALGACRFALKRVRPVHSRPDKEAHLLLLDAVKQGGPGVTLLPPLYLRDGEGRPTEEYRKIYALGE